MRPIFYYIEPLQGRSRSRGSKCSKGRYSDSRLSWSRFLPNGATRFTLSEILHCKTVHK